MADDLHRIGGGAVENLELKPNEAKLSPPGISLLRAPTPQHAVRQIRAAFPDATELHQVTSVVGSTTVEKIRSVGFDVVPNKTRKLPNHYRLIHPDGVAGFSKENLRRLSEVFTNSAGQ